ncbi:hypothetical protein HY972_01755 [Candidatus Kaiserbacteria bacterium]|nr:hypothetical protein [Candidatus Kaiserbacteria bacterium]
MTTLETAIRSVLDTAVWAPSGDNSQPWFFVLRGNTVRVHLEPDRDNPILNFKLSGTYIAHGALIENIVLAAPLSGLVASVQFLPDPANPHCTAEITFRETSVPIDPLASSIRNRHTNRKVYENRPLDPETLSAFSETVRPIKDPQLFLVKNRAAIHAIAGASAIMEQVALETPKLRELFTGDILWTAEENRSGKQGLHIDTMELPPPARFLMRRLSNPTIANLVNAIGFPKIARLTNTKLYASAPTMGLITIPEESPAAYLAAGRAFERVWLEATRRELAFHPVTGVLFLARSVQQGTTRGLLPRHFKSILEANAEIKKQFGAGKKNTPAMLFRTGYAEPPTARSYRRVPDIRTA